MRKIGTLTAQILQGLFDIVAAILGTYYAKKYAAITRRLGLARVPASTKRGFIVIQVDGLSHPHLTEAMSLGYAPHLQRLARRNELVLRPWRCGLPCSTPAAQAGIMFGNNEDIPAFRWYDKAAHASIVCTTPRDVQAIQDRIAQGRRGILAGGSSFMNMFDGDASLSIFTMGAMRSKRFFENVRGLGFMLLFLLNPFRTFKMILLSLWEYVVDFGQRTLNTLLRRTPRPLDRAFPFLRVVGNVIFREIQTFAMMVDIYRGVPAIYTTYYGYDELAHHYGPLSKVAMRALRSIDMRVRQIDSLRRLALTREYDLFILSDHGMSPAVPFHHAYGQTLGEFIRAKAGGEAALQERLTTTPQGVLATAYLLEELDAIAANVGPRLAHIPLFLRRLVAERIPSLREEVSDFSSHHDDLIVRSSGSMAHLYLNVVPRQMQLSEIATYYPNLASDLIAHPGIWLVIGREGGRVVIMAQEGVLSLDDGADALEGRDPLAILPNPRLTAAQLRRLARFPHAGDLILLGSYTPRGETVSCFEHQWACHGGLGGPQEVPFMMMERYLHWPLSQVTQATDLYPLFMRRYGEA